MPAATSRIRTALPSLCFLVGFSAFFPIGIIQALIVVIFILCLVLLREPRKIFQPLSEPSFYPMIVVLAWFGLCSIVDPLTEKFWLVRLFHVLLPALVWWLTGLLSQLDSEKKYYSYFLNGLVSGGFLAAILIVGSQSLGWNIGSYFNYLSGVVGNASSRVMLLLAVIAAVMLGHYLEKIRTLSWAGGWYFSTALVAAIFLAFVVMGWSFSRNSQLAYLLLLPLVIVHRWPTMRGFWVAFVVTSVVAFLSYQYSGTVQLRINAAKIEADAMMMHNDYFNGSVNVRMKMYQVAFENMLAHPFWGTGIGTWQQVWMSVVPVGNPAAQINNPHNDFLLYGMETGIPGLLTLVLLHAVFVWRGWVAKTASGAALLVLSAGLVVVSLFNAPYRDANLGLALILWMAWLAHGSFDRDIYSKFEKRGMNE